MRPAPPSISTAPATCADGRRDCGTRSSCSLTAIGEPAVLASARSSIPATGQAYRPRQPCVNETDIDARRCGSGRCAQVVAAHTPAVDRGAILIRAAALLRERAGDIARGLTLEQGKTLAESCRRDQSLHRDAGLERRGGGAHRRPLPAGPGAQRQPDARARTRRRGGGLYRVEFSGGADDAQAGRGAGRRLPGHAQGGGRGALYRGGDRTVLWQMRACRPA